MQVGIGVAAVLVVIGVWRLLSGIRSREWARSPWLRRSAMLCETIAWLSAGAGFAAISTAGGPVLLVTAVVAVIGRKMSLGLHGAVTAAGADSVRAHVRDRVTAASGRFGAGWKRVSALIAPDGWGEIRPRVDLLENLFSVRTIMRGYLLGLVVSPVLLGFFVAQALTSGSFPGRTLIMAVAAFNTLGVLSCLTLALAATLFVCTAAGWIGVLTVAVDLRAVMNILAASTGYGTAVALITAAFLPLIGGIHPISDAGGSAGGLSPQVLIDLPAVGAVLGYGFGLVGSAVSILRRATNVFVRRILSPSVFAVVLVAFDGVDLTPRGLLERAIPRADVVCDAVRLDASPDDPVTLFRAARWCGDGAVYLDDGAFLAVVVGVLFVVALGTLARDIHKAAEAAKDTAAGGYSGGSSARSAASIRPANSA